MSAWKIHFLVSSTLLGNCFTCTIGGGQSHTNLPSCQFMRLQEPTLLVGETREMTDLKQMLRAAHQLRRLSRTKHCCLVCACRAVRFQEPVLLVGETGTGKTTVVQAAAGAAGAQLHIVNCNQHTEASDFLGGFRPTR